MRDFLLVVLGCLVSAWLTKYYHFKELRQRAIAVVLEKTRREQLSEFFRNSRFLHEALYPVLIALDEAGHSRAIGKLQRFADEFEAQCVHILTNPPKNDFAGHEPELQFVLNVTLYLAERDTGSFLQRLPFDWDGILDPL